ncbi:MAG: anaerobic sulfatase maturase [Lachnospiraceae bacterium]
MRAVSILIKPASSGCNIGCKYCFYHSIARTRKIENYGVMSEQQLETVIKETINYADEFACFAFQGGEPTLAGLDFFKKAVELQKKYNKKNLIIQNTIQTNGTLIDKKWAEFLGKNKFLVGLSLDGPRGVNDFCRTNNQGESIFDKEMETVMLFRENKVEFNIVSVVTAKTVERTAGIYNFFKKKDFRYLQFIPCLDENERKDEKYFLEPEMYGEFLCKLFDLWYEDFLSGPLIEIRMFSNLVQMAAGEEPEECGMCGKCNTYFVVESDGSVYPCDFYTQDNWKLGNVEDGLQNLYNGKKSQEFMKISNKTQSECKECDYFYLCRGGCRRWRDEKLDGNLGVHRLCKGYKIFFEHCEQRIQQLGKSIKERYKEKEKEN